MRKIAIALAISLLPIISISPAEAKVCSYKRYQIKDTRNQAYTKYRYVTKRVCR